MTKMAISERTRKDLLDFLENNPQAELVSAYLAYVQSKFEVSPHLFPRDKIIYKSAEDAISSVEEKGGIWHETEIKIHLAHESVNAETTKIYICPFSGKVFGNNTHPNPQDAIYDWVSKCPENTEYVKGLKVKRFFVSEDPEVISSYISKTKIKEPIKKKVYSSVLSGKLFSSKEAVMKDFKNNYLKPISLDQVQSQNRFTIDERLLSFVQKELVEDKIADFIEALSSVEEFQPFVDSWIE